ncbi:hypothetical protein EVAR_48611_1 [Eumeta japonica]|uniref:Uncharacterized protein n=1 Tax=Eumeta variegata TaxID=151549 RepID=A0A4C1XXD7_EUMVA|nr:hypothetical protein EVAR_48611_1 [Eumeta japonica]
MYASSLLVRVPADNISRRSDDVFPQIMADERVFFLFSSNRSYLYDCRPSALRSKTPQTSRYARPPRWAVTPCAKNVKGIVSRLSVIVGYTVTGESVACAAPGEWSTWRRLRPRRYRGGCAFWTSPSAHSCPCTAPCMPKRRHGGEQRSKPYVYCVSYYKEFRGMFLQLRRSGDVTAVP